MEMSRNHVLIKRAGDVDLSLCLLFNRHVHRPRVQRLFAAISRLGDGLIWYTLMGMLPLLYGAAGLQAAVHMALVGACGVALYKLIKGGISRERPFVTHTIIQLGAEPLDRCSFPSGHTLHAVAFTLVAVHYFPLLALPLVPFALLVAASRLVLGLHYPSDVLIGALLGSLLAGLSFSLLPL